MSRATEWVDTRIPAQHGRTVLITHGVLPTVAAAALPEAHGGDFWGPEGRGELRGLPGHATPAARATDAAAAARLWTLSEELTGVSYDTLAVG